MWRRLLGCALAVAAAATAAACGDDDDTAATSDTSTTTEAPATTETSTTTEAPTTTEQPEPDEPRAPELAAITAEDLGPEWTEHTEAAGYLPPDDESCMARSEWDPAGLVDDGRYQGPISQRGDSVAFARTTVFEFTDDAAALAFVDLYRDDAFQQCVVDRMSDEAAGAEGAPEGSAIRLREITDTEGTGEDGFEIQLSYQFQATVDGELQDANGYSEELLFRDGPLVSVAFVEWTFAEDDPEDLGTILLDETVPAVIEGLARAADG
jgi:hypothetical protein